MSWKAPGMGFEFHGNGSPEMNPISTLSSSSSPSSSSSFSSLQPQVLKGICTQTRSFEMKNDEKKDSRFFNYINNLPALNLHNPGQVGEACRELNFSSRPQVFASLHVCSQHEAGLERRPQYQSITDVAKSFEHNVRGKMLAAVPDVVQPSVNQSAVELIQSIRMGIEPTTILPQPLRSAWGSPNELLADNDETLNSSTQDEENQAPENSFPNVESSLQNTLNEQHEMPFEMNRGAPEDISCPEFDQRSDRRNRKKDPDNVENEGCKLCHCKKSKCLKLYCECFSAGEYCVGLCSCEDCFNRPEYDDTVLEARQHIESRSPFAFAPKIVQYSIESPQNSVEGGSQTTLASSRHKRGCNCKKSKCQKKYCECYQAGVGCSIGCRCQGCENVYGNKGGSTQGFRIHGHSHQSLNLRDSMNGQGFKDEPTSQFERTLWGERFDGESAPSGKDLNDVERCFSHVRTTTPDDKQL